MVSFRLIHQIFSILTSCSTKELNLDVEVPGVGYTRQFRKCFEIDSQGQFAERVLITEYIKKFIDNDTKWKEDYTPVYFTIDDLEEALNFTLISEGVLLNEKSYAPFGQEVNLTDYTWTEKGVTYKVLEHKGGRYKVLMLNKKAVSK
mgnify:CR=1 FL=1